MAFGRICLATAAVALTACGEPQPAPIWGTTMGTHYSVQLGRPLGEAARTELEAAIEADLERVNRLMSTWREDSEVSRFNAHGGTDWFAVSAETARVVATAVAVSRLSDGAFDVTAGPVIRLWGFGPELPVTALPDAGRIAEQLARVGWRKLEVRDEPPALRKTSADVELDLSAIAKGYAVDVLTQRLADAGVNDFLVDIGGELCARGVNARAEPWTIAIETAGSADGFPTLLRPGYRCVATSGDYRNFFEYRGRRYSHAIDPHRGRPVEHSLASVTVVADDAMTADAWATALLVLGPRRGLELAERHGTAAYFMEREGDGLRRFGTDGFDSFEYLPD